eukprot:2132235-Amphidinium_carterae.1
MATSTIASTSLMPTRNSVKRDAGHLGALNDMDSQHVKHTNGNTRAHVEHCYSNITPLQPVTGPTVAGARLTSQDAQHALT